MIKRLFLANTDLWMGILMGALCALLVMIFLPMLMMLFGQEKIGLILAAGLGPIVGVIVYNSGLIEIKNVHRAIPEWFERRDPTGDYELEEGMHWILKWFGAMSFDEIDMQDRPTCIPDIPVEVRNGNKIPTDITVHWKPRAGSLYYYRNMRDIIATFTPEVKQTVRSFGIAFRDLDDMVEANPTENLSAIIREYLDRRSQGELTQLIMTVNKVSDDEGKEKDVLEKWKLEHISYVPAWAVEITGISVTDFELPENISAAANEVDEAERRIKAGKTLVDGLGESMKPFTDLGVDANAALATAQSVMMPDRPQTINTFNLTGLMPLATALGTAFGAAMGKASSGTSKENSENKDGK